jgi:dihydroorotate dehydrogenase electron transfer subunit
MQQTQARVMWNKNLGPLYYQIGLECPDGYHRAQPGQFVMIHLIGQSDPLLGRPFSIHRLVQQADETQGIELLYKVVGEGTRRMAALQPGDRLDVLGPLGQGFKIKSDWHTIYMVAGGIGVAPMIFLAEALQRLNQGHLQQELILGGRSKGDLLCVDVFQSLGVNVQISTDDGSAGTHGLVTQPLVSALEDGQPQVIFACGPMAMLRGVAAIAADHQIPCQVSLETMMACGMGACLGCAFEGRNRDDRYLHVCMDGPVFDTARLRL